MRFIIRSLALVASLTLAGVNPTNAQSADDPVILINPFVVPAGSEEEAVAMWKQARDFLATQPGYISTRLHRTLSPDATYTLINVAEWKSVKAFQAAITAMRQSASISPVDGVHGDPHLYRVIAN